MYPPLILRIRVDPYLFPRPFPQNILQRKGLGPDDILTIAAC